MVYTKLYLQTLVYHYFFFLEACSKHIELLVWMNKEREKGSEQNNSSQHIITSFIPHYLIFFLIKKLSKSMIRDTVCGRQINLFGFLRRYLKSALPRWIFHFPECLNRKLLQERSSIKQHQHQQRVKLWRKIGKCYQGVKCIIPFELKSLNSRYAGCSKTRFFFKKYFTPFISWHDIHCVNIFITE